MKSSRKLWWPPWILATICAAVYASTIRGNYAHTDDYPFLLLFGHIGIHGWRNEWSANGRPIYGWLLQLAFGPQDGICDLRWVRLAGLVSVFGAGWLVLRLYLRAGWGTVTALGASVLMVTTPAMCVFVGWASCFSHPLAAMLGLLAGEMAWRAVDQGSGRRRWYLGLACVVLLLTALAIYQITAAFFLLPALVRFSAQPGKRAAQSWLGGLALFFLGCAVYYAGLKLAQQHLFQEFDTRRGDLVHDVGDRMRFYFREPVWFALAQWAILLEKPWQVAVALPVGLLAFGGMLRMTRNFVGSAVLWPLLLTVATVGLASGGLLIIRDNSAPLRTLSMLYAIVLHFVVIAIVSPGARARLGWRMALLGLMVAANTTAAGYFVWSGIVRHQERELDRYRAYARTYVSTFPEAVLFVLPQLGATIFYPHRWVYEYGVVSSSAEWVSQGLWALVFNERFGLTKANSTVVERVGLHVANVHMRPQEISLGTILIDGIEILAGRPAATEASVKAAILPYFGELMEGQDGWLVSPWLGQFQVLDWPIILHREMGILWCAGKGIDDFWLYHPHLGWIWSSPKSYPYFVQGETKAWFRYLGADADGQKWENTKTGQVMQLAAK